MVQTISENFVPVRFHIKEQPRAFERFKAWWTPTVLLLDADGAERHRVEGFLPVDDFVAQLELGLARNAFEHKQYADAEQRFRAIGELHPSAGVAPEACYWAGVSAYKATRNPEPLRATAKLLTEKTASGPARPRCGLDEDWDGRAQGDVASASGSPERLLDHRATRALASARHVDQR